MIPALLKNSETQGTLRFTLKGVDVSVANSLRRMMIADIPSFVIRTSPYEESLVDIKTNTSRLNNEIIKQRLSCIPVHITDKDFPVEDYLFELKKENNTQSPMLVTTEDITVQNIASGTVLPMSEIRNIFPADPMTGDFISIVRLRPKLQEGVPGEGIHLTFKLSIGTGKQDGSFTADCTSTYSYTPDEARISSTWKALSAELKASGLSEDAIRTKFNDWSSIDARRLTIPDSFDFIVESVGVYENVFLVQESCRIASAACDNFEKAVNTGSLPISKSPTTIPNCYDVQMDNMDYTFGKVIENIIFRKYYDSGALTFCAFKKFHPHDSYGVLRLAFATDVDVENLKQYLIAASSQVKEIYAAISVLF